MANLLTAILRWLLLLVALVLTLVSLSTAFMIPLGIDWTLRLAIAGMVGERGYKFAFIPLAVALLAWLLKRRRSAVTVLTLGLCLAAFGFTLKPDVQAWEMNLSLPAQLTSAFGSAAPNQQPFSFAALYAPMPAPVPIEEMTFVRPLRLDFYHAVGRKPAPCVILLHGGGWFSGSHRDRRPFDYWLARQGYAVATIDYRLLPEWGWPAPKEDVISAIDFLRARAGALGIDPNRIVLLGRSAGGQLALATGYAVHDRGICGVISIYGPSDFGTIWNDWNAAADHDRLNGWTGKELLTKFLGGGPDVAKAAYASASGLELANAASPPTLLIHGRLDSLVSIKQSEIMAERLAALGRPNLLVSIPWAAHSFDTVNFDGPGSQIEAYAVRSFLDAVTR